MSKWPAGAMHAQNWRFENQGGHLAQARANKIVRGRGWQARFELRHAAWLLDKLRALDQSHRVF